MKSFTSVEQKVCPVTGKSFDVGVLLDTKMRDSLERTTVTGWQVCPEVQEQLDKGFVALIVVDPEKSTLNPDGSTSPDGAYRTGEVIYMRREVFNDVFQPVVKDIPFAFIDMEAAEYVKSLVPDEDKEEEEEGV